MFGKIIILTTGPRLRQTSGLNVTLNLISDAYLKTDLCHPLATFEPPRGKTNNVVFEQVRHKPTCTSTEKS